MKIVLIGATGFVGSAIRDEALDRGHEVTAVVRNAGALPEHPSLSAISVDVYDAADVARAVRGHDAIISAFSPGLSDPNLYSKHLDGMRAIIDGVRRSQVRRLLVVGGAGRLEVAPGRQLVDTPEFPEQWKQTALATRDAGELLQKERNLDWSLLSPAPHLEPGERTGSYRFGTDQLLDENPTEIRISLADYAREMIDELENPRHVRVPYTIAY